MGRARQKEPAKPVNHKSSIIAAFAKQIKQKSCPVCRMPVPFGLYRKHIDSCAVKSDDSDCEILQVLTGSESRTLKAGPAIIINDENDTKPTLLENSQLAPFSFEDDADVPGTSNNAIHQVISQRLELKQENAVSSTSRVLRRSTRLSISATKENVNPQSEESKEHEVTPKRRRRTKLAAEANISFVRSPSIVPPLVSNLEDNSPERQGIHISRIDIINKIKEILSRDNTALDENVPLDDNDAVLEKTAPHFVTSVLRMVQKIMASESEGSHIYDEQFWKDDLVFFKKFVNMSANARLLFLRMFLRKRMWLTEERMRQRYREIEDISITLRELVEEEFIDFGDGHMTDLSEALKLLPIASLKTVGKHFQMDLTKAKHDLIIAMISFASQQKGLFGNEGAVLRKMLQVAKKELGPCYRVNARSSLVFKAVFTLYTPTETNSALIIETPNINIEQQVLFQMLQMKIGQLKTSAPTPCNSIINIYKNRRQLYEYVEAKESEIAMLNLLKDAKFEEAIKVGKTIRENISVGRAANSLSTSSSMDLHLRRFTSHWVYVRCLAHTATLFEKQKRFAHAVNWQRFIVDTESLKGFCIDGRGAVWDRLALNLDSHLKVREEALDVIKAGMKDPSVKAKDRLLLQDRAIRITKGDFLEQIVIQKPVKKEIMGHTLSKELGDSRLNRFMFKDGDGQFVECSVEEVVRRHYIEKEGFSHGIHAEGTIWHSLMGLLFDDILFSTSYPVWFSELQTSPTDLNFESFYLTRKKLIDTRLDWLASASSSDVEDRIERVWMQRNGETNSEIHWELFSEFLDCQEFFKSVPRQLLVALFRRVLVDYRNTRSGFPDLTMWNTDTKTVAVVEVKGPGDRLSTKQRLWLDFFSNHGVRSEVCHVIAQSDKRLR